MNLYIISKPTGNALKLRSAVAATEAAADQPQQQQQQQQHYRQSLSLSRYRSQQQRKRQRRDRFLVIFRYFCAAVAFALAFACVTYTLHTMGWFIALLVALFALLLTRSWRWFYIAGATANRDLTALWAYGKLLRYTKRHEKLNFTVADVFERSVRAHPDKVAVISETQKWTFRQVNEHANRVANVLQAQGYQKGDVVGLLLENRAEYMPTWLGLSKIGVITPLINTNLRGPSLLHSLTVANCNALIYGEDFIEAVSDVTKDLPKDMVLYQYNNENNNSQSDAVKNAKNLNTLLSAASVEKPGKTQVAHHDKLVYIYTSGTTGLPKAAVISHSRYLFIAAGIHYTMGFKDDDIFYTPLPLYHTAGGIMCMGQSVLFGSTVSIRKKFSASNYFADCAKFNATVGQYIGEMARYILATKPSEHDRAHNVRLVYGNGLRPQIWPQFVERFNIAKVGEFYGATEGNANIMNHDNTVGAIGFVSRILPKVYPISIIRADPDTGEPIRNEQGLCQLCEPNEPGVFIGKIVKGNPSREFLGYVDAKASAKKIVKDVFKHGDMAFISGDLLVADEKGYLYFKDRTGDTFRWKGENVSTSEVEAQVSNVAGYKDTVVYGINIPHTEGRAGMAAIYDPNGELDLDAFAMNLAKVLPAYARPQILRLLTKVDLTGTFKLRKVDLQKEGYDPNVVKDSLYYQTPKGRYELLTPTAYEQLQRNEIRF